MSTPNSVLEKIEDGWTKLNALVDSLGPQGLTIRGEDDWAVKDHLIHVAAWEISLIALLQGADRTHAMGAPRHRIYSGDPLEVDETDAINASVWSAHKDKSPEAALQFFRDTHSKLMAVLSGLSDEDLERGYNHYQPNYPKPSPTGDRPVIDWVSGNTYDHYAEHVGWIDHLIESRTAR